LPPVRVGGPERVVAPSHPPKIRLRRRFPPARLDLRSRAARPRATPRAPAPSGGRPRFPADRGRPRTRARSRSRPSAGSSAAPPPRSRLRPSPPEPFGSFLCLLARRHGFPLAPPGERAALLQLRPAAPRAADVDRIEVPGHDRVREDRPRLADDLASEVAVREMRQREELDLGGACDPGRLERRRVLRLPRALPLVLAERRLVDEDVGVPRGLDHRLGGTPVSGDPALAPGTSRAEHLVRGDRRTVRERDRLAALQGAPLRAGGDTERVGRLDVETPGPRFLHERVADRGDAVRNGERLEAVVLADQLVARAQLLQLDGVAQPSEDPPQRAEEVSEAR